MDPIMASQNSYVQALTPQVALFGDKAYQEVKEG